MFRDKAGNLSIGKIILTVFLLLVIAVAFLSAYVVVPPGHTGVIVTMGKVSDTVLQEGLHFKILVVKFSLEMNNAYEGSCCITLSRRQNCALYLSML